MLKFVWLKQFLFWVIIFCLFTLTNFALAQECIDPEPAEEQHNTWYEYRCEGSNCGENVLRQLCEEVCSRNCECLEDNGSWEWSCSDWICNTSCGSSETYRDCSDWQVCKDSTIWGSSNKSCECESSCLEQPTNSSPPNGEPKVQLPVTLTWNGVSGANSYRYKVDTFEDYTTNNQVTIDEEGNCLLKSNTNYNWQVQACCNSYGNDCGGWSDHWSFKTSLAPQLISPENNATNISIPVNFDWCDVLEAQNYYIKAYMEGRVIPIPIEKKDGILYSQISFGQEFFTKNTTYQWEVATCLQEDRKKCGLECEESQGGDECGDYSKRLAFTTGDVITLPVPKIISPKSDNGIPIVNFSSRLAWELIGVYGVFSYRYEIKKAETTVLSSFTSTASPSVPFSSIWPSLEYDKTYTWEVKSCWDVNGNDCEPAISEGIFKTTGVLPNLLSPAPDSENITIPVALDWEDIKGALSYKYEFSTDSTFSDIAAEGIEIHSKTSVGYPELEPLIQYHWRVKSCADKNGEFCGNWGEGKFTTSEVSLPINPYPEDNGNLSTSEKYLRWEKSLGANFYQYKVDYGGVEKIPPTIVSTNSALLPMEKMELGEYAWYVQSCTDEGCQEASGFSGPWHFIVVQPADYEERGLVPCGRNYDNPDTPWNERESCQFKHIFYLLNNILNFLLWRLGLIVLVLLAVATGVIYYFSMGAPSTMIKVKSVLISAGKGYGIILLAWLIINWILVILGFQIEFFGNWSQISF